MSVNRRAILKSSVALAAGGLSAATNLRNASAATMLPDVPEWMHAQGRPILSPACGEPSKYEKDVIRRIREPRATDTEAFVTPLQNLHGIITPNGLVFERHHAGAPEIPPDQYRLVFHGLVERPLVFTMD